MTTTKTTTELQCLEVQAIFEDFMEDHEEFDELAVDLLQVWTLKTTPMACWDVTLPHMLRWAFERWGIQATIH